jgi:hypothetical protein
MAKFFEWLLNAIMKPLLRSPLHGVMSHRVMLITFTGRKTGKRYTTPISYMRDGETVSCITMSQWWKNIPTGSSVTVRLRGRDYVGTTEIIRENPQALADGLTVFFQTLPEDGAFWGVKIDEQRQPIATDIQRAANTPSLTLIHAHLTA